MDAWTPSSWAVVTGLLVAVVLVVVLAVALARQRRVTRDLMDSAAAERAAMEQRLTALETPRPAPAVSREVEEFVITEIGQPRSGVAEGSGSGSGEAEVAARIDGRLFADVVLRETVVKAASWTHGVRHALSPENRNRIRFEMKRETKRATRRHKADVKEALRQYYASQDAEEKPR